MIAPSRPSSVSERRTRRSSRLETPPDATTGLPVRLQHAPQQLDVRAAEGAVLVHVGDDVAGAAGLLEPGQHVVEVAALARPAARGERRAAHVEPDGDPVAVDRDGLRGPVGVLERGRADVHAVRRRCRARARGSRRRGCRRRARPAPRAPGRSPPAAPPAFSPRPKAASRSTRWIQAAPCRAQSSRRLDRVAVAGLAAGLALHEAHGLAVRDVDGGQQLEGAGERVGSQGLQPVGEQAEAGVAGLLGVELRGRRAARSRRRRRRGRRGRTR